jgi:chemotaxis protein CheX
MNPDEKTAESKVLSDSWIPKLELASREVFDIMLRSKLGEPDEDKVTAPEFTAMVGFAGQLRGVLSLRCSSKSAAIMAAKMLGVEVSHGDEQVWDAVGEIANMIAGNFKNKLNGMGDGCMLSVPTVITGSDYNCRFLTDSGTLEVRFVFEGAPMSVELQVHS